MELTPREIDDLLGAWALEALSPDEHDAVDRAINSDSTVARRAAELLEAVVEVDESFAREPSAELRTSLLRRARTLPRHRVEAAQPLTVLESQVSALRQLLADLSPHEWDRPVSPYDWTVHGLVAHLLVIERYTSAQLGLGENAPDGQLGHLEMGRAEIAEELRRAPQETVSAWSRVALDTIDLLRRGRGPGPDDPIEFHRWPFTSDSLAVVRSFEIWTHADDIRRATGRALGTPAPSELSTMSRLSVHSLPLVLPIVAPARQFVGARVVLTGDGGATYDLGSTEPRTTLIVADVVDYCRLAARRITLEELEHEVEGDVDCAHDLLAAAQVFAL